MSASALPAPGLVHGVYPQKQDPGTGFKANLENVARKLASKSGRKNTRYYLRKADWVLALESRYSELSARQLETAVGKLAVILHRSGLRHAALLHVLAITRELIWRETGLKAYRNQVCASLVMLDHRLAEMHTGEGKTLSTNLAALAAAIAGIPVHVITANDFLVTRDADQLRPIAAKLGLTTGAIVTELEPDQREKAYRCSIVYCTGKELVFDYLRDNLGKQGTQHDLHHRLSRLSSGDSASDGAVLRGLCLALIDEADSILLDEATTPLIISRQSGSGLTEAHYHQAFAIAEKLEEGLHFNALQDSKQIELTPLGTRTVRQFCRNLPGLWQINRFQRSTVTQALIALHRYHRDKDYLIANDEVHIIDPTTGRIAEGRQWSKGLHQFIELKEGCPLSQAFQPLARITYQRFFPRYLQLGGTSATLREAKGELLSLYSLPVVSVPLNHPSQRLTAAPKIFRNAGAKWTTVIARTKAKRAEGRPILIATESVGDSELLSGLLEKAGIPHVVLNARQNAEEAEIVARAGKPGCVTVATNMAGRGTDISISSEIKALGGLHVISCQLNGARRIDRQLHGRCARQGSPGSVETLLSLEELLFRQFLPRFLHLLLARTSDQHRPLGAWAASLLPTFAQYRYEHQQRRIRSQLRKADKQNRQLLGVGGRE